MISLENPLAVANYFIQQSFDSGIEVTPMKAIKLVYVAHGWYLGMYKVPLISEAIQAWKYGPVIETVYQIFKKYGNKQITKLHDSYNDDGITITPIVNKEIEVFLNKIWDVYKNFNGLQLSTLTHQANTPWDIVYNQMGKGKESSLIISNEIIKNHYVTKIANNA